MRIYCFGLITLFLCLLCAPCMFSQEVPLDELIDRVLERSELIQSGVFRTTRHRPSDDNPTISGNAELDACELKYVLDSLHKNRGLVFRGTEWAVSSYRSSYENPYSIVKENYQAEYSAIRQPDGEIDRLYRATPKTKELSDFFQPSYTFLGAGRIHTVSLRNYIRKNKGDARDFGNATLANGDVVRHIQFTIPKKSYGVLRQHATGGKDIWDFDAMLLNIYVMPEKGYVVRRIDECLPDGTIKIRYDSVDFVDRGNGIFFPSVFTKITVASAQNRAYASKYEILEASMLNEEIPDRYFDRQLVKGTRITDWRDSALDEGGNPRRFNITRDGFASELDVLYEEWKEAEKQKTR